MRAGTRTELGRKWGPVGHRPLSPVKIGFETVYLYLALCPFTGNAFASFLPKLNGTGFSWFVQEINKYLDRPTLLVAEGAKAHSASCFKGTRMTLSKLPPYCPELNPVERVFKGVRRRLKHRVFGCLDEAQDRIRLIIEALFEQVETVINLACFPYTASTLPQK